MLIERSHFVSFVREKLQQKVKCSKVIMALFYCKIKLKVMKLKSGRLGPWDDDADADTDDAGAGEENDAKTTISCLYWLHDAASGCDILQTI